MDKYPESMACETWSNDELNFSIVQHRYCGHYCGYVRFPKRPLIEPGYQGIATYVPVHGGLTFAQEDPDGSMIYGFDCGHANDETNSDLRDISYLRQECERMAAGIKIAATYEKRYLSASTSQERANILDEYHKQLEAEGIAFHLADNFGAMLSVLSGKL